MTHPIRLDEFVEVRAVDEVVATELLVTELPDVEQAVNRKASAAKQLGGFVDRNDGAYNSSRFGIFDRCQRVLPT